MKAVIIITVKAVAAADIRQEEMVIMVVVVVVVEMMITTADSHTTEEELPRMTKEAEIGEIGGQKMTGSIVAEEALIHTEMSLMITEAVGHKPLWEDQAEHTNQRTLLIDHIKSMVEIWRKKKPKEKSSWRKRRSKKRKLKQIVLES